MPETEFDYEHYQVEAARQRATSTRTKRNPADDLAERRTCMIRFTRTGDADIPTVKDLMRHAERHGGECVAETAAELGYGVDALIRVIDACDRGDLALLRKTRPNARLEKRASSEDRAKAILGIKDDE